MLVFFLNGNSLRTVFCVHFLVDLENSSARVGQDSVFTPAPPTSEAGLAGGLGCSCAGLSDSL